MADFHLAVKAGDLVEVKRFLSQGQDIGEVNTKTGINSLHLAILTGNYDIVELLSKDEEHINSTCSLLGADCEGYTPLHFSVDLCNKSITQLLLSRKANVNKQNKYGNTALHVAARCGIVSEQTKRFFLNDGKMYSENDICLNILQSIKERATIDGYCEITDILLQSGANAQLVNINRETALHLACLLKNDNMARIILKKCSSIVNYKNDNSRTALHITASSYYSNYALVKLLIESGADVNASDYTRSSPLYYACKEKNLEVVQILVENGCNVNIGGRYKPIIIAVDNCDEKILKLLLMHGADISLIDSFSSFHISPYEKINYELILFESCCNDFFKREMGIFADYENCKNISSTCIVSYFETFKLLLQHGRFKNIDRRNLYFGHRQTIPTCFVKYVIKMKTLGCFFARDYPDTDVSNINLLPDEKEYEENCKKEVGILEGKFVCSDITLLEFLKKDLNKMVRLLKNQEIVNVLKCYVYEILPIYQDLIKAFYKFSMQSRSMLNRCYECFNIVFCQLPELPDIVVENIFDFFTTEDLRILLTTWDPYY